ncbi:MAG TPA: DNA-directed RNA polymerase subunit beta [Patescibacteria group bacterium]|nr:DNA-directed RNA polymerase subunit beta [Patescibacteria group bacterium]
MSSKTVLKRKYFQPINEAITPPNLIEVQTDSYDWFLREGLKEIFAELNPVEDFIGKNLELNFLDYNVEAPKYSEEAVRQRNLTYRAPVRCKVQLVNKNTGEIKEQNIFLGDFPLMTSQGTFIINGVERVVVSQLVRAPGVLFTSDNTAGFDYFGAKIIPERGAWLEFETSAKNVIYVKIDRKRKIPFTTLLRSFGFGKNEEIYSLFADVNTDPDRNYVKASLEKDPANSVDTGILEVYKRIRPGDLATVENAKTLIDNTFFNFRRYDMSKIGRYKINKRLKLETPNDIEHRVLQREDVIAILKEIMRLNNDPNAVADDIDNLKNRRVRAVGELVAKKVRVGFLRVERNIKDRMSVVDINSATPAQLINVRPITASLQEFFASSQLSQFMDQVNPLSELEHKRKLTATGPGGLTRERAGFEVRDVHVSHYGRLCPIESPEGPSIGLISYFSTFARVNEYNFIETPYIWIQRKAKNDGKETIGHYIRTDITDEKGKIVAKDGEKITKELAEKLKKLPQDKIRIKPRVTGEVVYLDAGEEETTVIAQANAKVDERGYFTEKRIAARNRGEPDVVSEEKIDYMDVSPRQVVSVATALIPFIEHDELKRALMGSNMLRQAVPLVKPDSPIVGTGMEGVVAANSGEMLVAEGEGKVSSANSNEVIVNYKDGTNKSYHLKKFIRSTTGTCINQRINVDVGDKVEKGTILSDSYATENGEIALGKNVLIAFMPWGGYNFEDAIIISEKLIHRDGFSSIHIEHHEVEVRDTKLGPEIITRDIPNVGDEALKNLDGEGIIRIGAEIKAGDILVGKITPKGETELTPEERLLRAIFGEKARDVKDVSLKLPHGEYGKVVGIKEFSRDYGDELPTGVIKRIQVAVAQFRKISVGDKMAGRHGNKGIVSKIMPVEDMPMLADGTPIDIVLNPLGIISRMNVGQLLETHLGYAASILGYKVASPVFSGVTVEQIGQELIKAGKAEDGKEQLFDGRTGEPFQQRTTVGIMYMMKLHHLVDDKIHARSIGPYSLVTQQPLGGRAQFGGQRFGEMEVWALEGYGAAHTLQEMLTIKSDDVWGRRKAYESIIKNEEIRKPSIPESFNVLVKELEALGLSVDLIRKSEGGGLEIVDAELASDMEMRKIQEENAFVDEETLVEELKDITGAALHEELEGGLDIGEGEDFPTEEEILEEGVEGEDEVPLDEAGLNEFEDEMGIAE